MAALRHAERILVRSASVVLQYRSLARTGGTRSELRLPSAARSNVVRSDLARS
jgi:hypothetical protein